MTDKQIIIDGCDVSNFCLVCYYDNKTNELVRIEQYNDNDSSMYSDIESYKYGYNAKIVKPEEIIKQLKAKEQECERWKENLPNAITRLMGELDQAKVENEKLKKDVERWKSNFNGKVSAIEELIQIIQQALKDFSIEVGTPQYDRLLNGAKSLGIEVKDYE